MPAAKSIVVNVIKVSGIRGVRGDNLSLLVRVELGDVVLGESSRVECISGLAEPNLTFTVERPPGMHGAAWLDSLLSRPLVISCMEVLAKEKRGSRDDKTQTIGQSCVDLLSLVTQGSPQTLTVPVLPISSDSPLGAQDESQSCCVVEVCADYPLMDPSWDGGSNIVRVRVDSLHSLPEPWTSGSTTQYSYCAVLPVPLSETEVETVKFSGGVLKQPDKTAKKPVFRTWSNPSPAVGPCTQLRDSEITKVPYEEEDGELKSAVDEERRHIAENQKPSVIWHAERRCFLSPDALQAFSSQLRKHTLWPVEIVRIQQVQAVPKAKRLSVLADDSPDRELSFHGVAFVDLAGLLYPGVNNIRGAYPIVPFLERDVVEKTGQKGHARSALQSTSQSGERLKSATVKKVIRSPSSQRLHADTAGAPEAESSNSLSDARMYEESNSYLMFEVSLDAPLIRKRSLAVLAEQVSEYISPRSAMPQYRGSAEQAVAALHRHFNALASSITEEMAKYMQEKAGNSQSQPYELLLSDVENIGRTFVTKELKPSGKYNMFREQLKHAVVQVVREKFQHVAAFSERTALEAFLPRLYSFLVDELQKCLHKRETDHNPLPATQSQATCTQLLLFADEAENEGDLPLADTFYRKCIALDGSAAHWIAYAKFLLLQKDAQRATECLKEAISKDQKCLDGLLLFALVSSEFLKENDVAELFYERACCEQKNIAALTLMGLYYESTGKITGVEHTFRQALRQHKEANTGLADEVLGGGEQVSAPDGGETCDETADVDASSTPENKSIDHDDAAPPAVDITVAQVSPKQPLSPAHSVEEQSVPQDENTPAQVASESQVTLKNEETELSAAAGESQVSLVQGNITESQASLNQSGKPKSPTILQNSVILAAGSAAEIQSEPSQRSGERNLAKASPSIFYQAAEFALSCHVVRVARHALGRELRAHGPSQAFYVAKARLHLQEGEFEEVKECLQEALSYAYDSPCIWALYGHVHYLCGKKEEAMSAYKRTLDLPGNTNERHLVQLRLGNICLEQAMYAEAKRVYLCICRELPSVRSWLGVGVACYRLGEIDESESALSEANRLYNMEPRVWAYLSLISLQKRRKQEAEQTFKYAIKTGLTDSALLKELNALQLEVGFGDASQV